MNILFFVWFVNILLSVVFFLILFFVEFVNIHAWGRIFLYSAFCRDCEYCALWLDVINKIWYHWFLGWICLIFCFSFSLHLTTCFSTSLCFSDFLPPSHTHSLSLYPSLSCHSQVFLSPYRNVFLPLTLSLSSVFHPPLSLTDLFSLCFSNTLTVFLTPPLCLSLSVSLSVSLSLLKIFSLYVFLTNTLTVFLTPPLCLSLSLCLSLCLSLSLTDLFSLCFSD